MAGDRQSCGRAAPRSGASRDATKVADLPIDGGYRVVFSPDGKWLMTTAPPCRLWAVGTWREARQIGGEGRCFSPDGRLVVVADATKVIRLVETETGRTLARLESPDLCSVASASFSPDGSRLVVTTNDGPAVHVWDLRAIRRHLAKMGLDWDAPPIRRRPGRPIGTTLYAGADHHHRRRVCRGRKAGPGQPMGRGGRRACSCPFRPGTGIPLSLVQERHLAAGGG